MNNAYITRFFRTIKLLTRKVTVNSSTPNTMKQLVGICLTVGSLLTLVANETDTLTELIRKYLLDYPLFVVCNHQSHKTEESLSKVLQINHHKMLTNAENLPAIRADNKSLHTAINYIIVAYDTQELTHLLSNLSKTRRWNNKVKHLLLLTSKYWNNSTAAVSFQQLWKYRVFNVVLLLYTSKNSSTFTWYPYSKQSSCGSKVILKQFDLTMDSLFNPFENKLPKKLHGCPAKVLWKKHYNVVKDPFSKTDPGVLIELLRAVAKATGLTLEFDRQSNYIVSDEYNNRTNAINLTKKVISEKFDIVAAIYGPSIFGYVDERISMSSRVMKFASYWVIPFPSPLSLWSVLVKTFNIPEYIILLLTLIFSVCMWHLGELQGPRSVSKSFWAITKLTFQRAVKPTTATRSAVLILMIWLTFNVVNIYNSRLVSLITHPAFLSKPRTLSELSDRNYDFAYREYLNLFLHARDPQLAQRLERKRIDGIVPRVQNELQSLLNNLTYVTEIDSFPLSWLENPWDLEILQEVVRNF